MKKTVLEVKEYYQMPDDYERYQQEKEFYSKLGVEIECTESESECVIYKKLILGD